MKIKNFRKIKLGIIFGIVIILGSFLNPIFYINQTGSEPRGIYLLKPFKGHLKPGDLVIIDVPKQIQQLVYSRGWLKNGECLLKNVGAIPGDKITITDNRLTINNKYIGSVALKDSKGLFLPRIRGNFYIKPGYFLPIATKNPKSFDGRYFGPVPFQLIRGIAIPILHFR